MLLSSAFRPVSYDDLPGWREDDQTLAFEAFRRSAFRVLEKLYRTGSLGVDCAATGTGRRSGLTLSGLGLELFMGQAPRRPMN